MTILDKIVANKRIEVEQQKKVITLQELIKKVEAANITKTSFRESLLNSSTGIIAEFKRRSPSKDWIFKEAKVEQIIPLYSENGAAAISVLTDLDFFGGTLEDLQKAQRLTQTPLLRKDFMVEEYQVYQAKLYGASAVLLIAAALTIEETNKLAQKAKDLGLDVLLEIHNEEEIGHINKYVDVVGVNNRNLSTFVTSIKVSFDLADKIPSEFLRISESGISDTQTVKELQKVGYRGFLMGENFMKTSNPGEALKTFIEELNKIRE